jgi:shikimate kinase
MNSTNFKRIVLIGFRGTGKSTIGKRLAADLKWEYLSTDEQIEKIECKTIDLIVKKKGWEYFRKLEADVIEKLPPLPNMVIDAGGGVVEDKNNIKRLSISSIIVWIDAQVEDIIKRLQQSKNRPLLNRNNLIKDIKYNYKKRRPIYKRYSNLQFNTSIETPKNICNKIISTVVLR